MPRLIPATPETDPVLAEIIRLRPIGKPDEGWCWASIGAHLSIAGSAAQQKYARYLATLGQVPEVYRGRRGTIGEPPIERPAPAPAEPKPAGTTEAVATWTGLADGSAVIESGKGPRIKTLDQLLATCEVDLGRWEVDRWVANKWDNVMRSPEGDAIITELFQVKAWIRPIPGMTAVRELIDGLLEDLRNHAPDYRLVEYPAPNPDERHLLVASMADHHIGMLAWGEETGQSDYDSDIAERLASEAMNDLLRKASVYPCERVLVLIGGDWYHTDRALEGKGGTTTAGTPQDVDTRYQKMWRTGLRAAVAIVDAARQFAPVTIQITPGNHDTDRLMALGDVLHAWYRNDGQVEIRNDPTPRHYFQYGATLLGFCHGHQAKGSDLPLLMASEAPNEWAATEFREWLTGHFHAKRTTSDDKAGVQVHVTPSLCPPDSWHAGRGLLHRRSCEARIYHISDGPIATLTFNSRRGRV